MAGLIQHSWHMTVQDGASVLSTYLMLLVTTL